MEGDAILFFRPGEAPTPDELRAQVENMYAAFHSHLKLYEHQRICQCGACSTAIGLELKFVVHQGMVAQERIKDHSKLFGRDVILIHRLLKNDVPHDEYALFTPEVGPIAPAKQVRRGTPPATGRRACGSGSRRGAERIRPG